MIPFVPRKGQELTAQLFDLVQEALAVTLRSIMAQTLLGAVVLSPQIIGTTDTRVRHGLGRRPAGYFLVQSPADVRVFDGLTPESKDPANYISLRLSSSQRVTLLVF